MIEWFYESRRGFEVAKGWEDKNIRLPKRSTAHAAAYDLEAAGGRSCASFPSGD